MDFKDNFSKQSEIYARYRPHYPAELYAYLSALCEKNDLAWDCGTGNGQAAIDLAGYFKQVIATDPSEQQINNAFSHEGITYRIEKAEQTSLDNHSADLITIANALHWLEFEVFYKEVARVLKPNGIIAAWCYRNPSVSPEIDALVKHFHDVTLGTYWLAENRLVDKEYTTIPFPFQRLESPEFYCEKGMDLPQFIGYLNTWSATQRFITKNDFNPTEDLRVQLEKVWGETDQVRKLVWKLVLIIGRQ